MSNNLPDKNVLDKSLYILYNMEVNNYAMTKLIKSLSYEINKLGRPRNISAPKLGAKEYSLRKNARVLLNGSNSNADKSGKVKPYRSKLGNMDGVSYILPLICVIVAIILVIINEKSSSIGIIWKIISVIINGAIFGTIAFFVGLGLAWLIALITGKARRNDEYETARRQYDVDMQLYNAAVERDNRRVQRELVKQTALITQRDSLINRKKQATDKLKQFYDMVGIESSFRNIIPIGYMYEFSKLGIANKLGGADGLYYLVKKELRADQMQCTLDVISKKLDIIIDQNSDIYREIRNIDYKCDQMISSLNHLIETTSKANKKLDSISENNSVSAYNSQRILEERRFTNYMMVWNTIKH